MLRKYVFLIDSLDFISYLCYYEICTLLQGIFYKSSHINSMAFPSSLCTPNYDSDVSPNWNIFYTRQPFMQNCNQNNGSLNYLRLLHFFYWIKQSLTLLQQFLKAGFPLICNPSKTICLVLTKSTNFW